MKKRPLAGILSVLAILTLCACSLSFSASVGNSNDAAENAESADTENADTADATKAASKTDWPLTIQDMLDANIMGTLSMVYGSVRADYVRPEAGEYDLVMEYADTPYLYREFVGEEDLYALDGSSGYCRVKNAEEEYIAFVEYEPTFYAGSCFALNADTTALEEIVNVTEDGDKIIMTTNLDTELLRPYYEYDVDGFPYDDGDTLETVYTLNAEDYAVLGSVTTVIHADGSREEQERVTMTYDVEMPEGAAALAARKESDDIRTVTIKVNPGTPDEYTEYATAQKGDAVLYTPPEGYTLYADAECTIPDYEAEIDLYADATWYAAPDADAGE